jgi:LPXTG-motif cell wall-anchored protein
LTTPFCGPLRREEMGTVFIVILMVLILAGIGLVSLFRRR